MTPKPTGTFCWADLVPTDQARAIDFYATLAGWNAAVGGPEFGGYALAFGPGDEGSPAGMVAGINPSVATIESFKASQGAPPSDPPITPAWTIYLATSSIEASVEAVVAAGGRELIPRMEIPGMGSSALCAEPTGAAFGFWQGTGHQGFGAFGEPGAFCWTEVYSTDAAVTRDFFVAALGLESTTLEESESFVYHQLTVPGQDGPAFGVMQRPPSMQGRPSQFGAYLYVSDVDAALGRVTANGGSADGEPMDTPFGRMVSIIDSEGASISLVDPTAPTVSAPSPAAGPAPR